MYHFAAKLGARPDGGGVGLAFVVGWVALTVAFDGAWLYGLARQCRTLGYAEAVGTVTRSEVVTEDDGGSRGYALRVGYTYSVGGAVYTGDRYRHGGTDGTRGGCERLRQRLPVGGRVPVYYDPAAPADAVLDRGPAGGDLVTSWFLAPFNLIVLGGLHRMRTRHRPGFDPADPRLVRPTAAGWTLHPAGRDGWPLAAEVLLGVTFAGCFGIGFLLPADPPLGGMLAAWAAALGVSGWAGRRRANRTAAALDADAGTLTVGGRVLPAAAVTAVGVEVEREPGGADRWYHAVVSTAGERVRVERYADEAVAAALADWLRERLGL